jgi:hypothetical protein
MKSTVWITAVVLLAGSICGCAEKKESSNVTSAGTSQPATTQDGGQQVTFKSSTPEEAVTEFLDALRSGNDKTAEALLTTKAREETAAHDMVVAPPGAPNATYAIGRVQHLNGQEDVAWVSCTWSEKNGTEATSYEVAWNLRKEAAGWRIAGMATQLGDADEIVHLNFEDLSQLATELENAEREAAVANRPKSTPPAQNSDAATTR